MPPKRRFYKRRPKRGTPVPEDTTESESLASTSDVHKAKKVKWREQDDPTTPTKATASYADSSDEEDVVAEKVCLAAFCQYGRLGCAYYDPVKRIIYALEDTQEGSHYDLIKMVLEQASADVILTSSRSDDGFIDCLQEHSTGHSSTFQIRPHKDFTPQKGRDRLLSLELLAQVPNVNNEPGSSDASDSTMTPGLHSRNAYDFMKRRGAPVGDPTRRRWGASIRMSNFVSADSSPLCMSSIGALIDQLVRERIARDLDDDPLAAIDVRDIEALTLTEEMHINADALFSLQVFENESHASIHSNRSKEGLSLFGILNTTHTTLGRSLLRTWFLRPSLSIPVITARHDAVECLTNPENLLTSGVMRKHLKGIKNMPQISNTLKVGRGKLSDWQGLVKFTFHATMLREAISELQHSAYVPVVKKLIEALEVTSFKELGTAVNEIIDWEESASTGRVCVRPQIDEELDSRKHVYYGIDAVLSQVAGDICSKVPERYTSLNVVYFPQLGYLICVPMLEDWKGEGGIEAIDGWVFQFSSNDYVYFKSQEMRDMDTHIGDLHSAIVDREIEVIQDLLERILVHMDGINHACDVCAELDCLLAFAQASIAYNYKRPYMVDENIIDISQGRHPLHEQIVDTFVPNDCYVTGAKGFDVHRDVDEGHSIILCTGANGCGKSVYLKQIALIQYMAQIGCFVPAELATLGIVDKILTRVSTRESVSKAQSSFMIDLNQVSLALRNCTARSLVLLDEFGKGTLSTDGAGLFCGVIHHLLSRGAGCPKVLAATHFHDVFHQDIMDVNTLPITFLHMQIMFVPADGNDSMLGSHESQSLQRMTYLYRVAPGLSTESHAAKCAEVCGLPLRYVQRAQYVSELISKHEIVRLLDEEMTEEERGQLEEAEAICRRFIAWDLQAEAEDPSDIHRKLATVLGIAVDETASEDC
ncbi:DNA mismatch repair MutS family protein [Pleurotus pulmonarius]